MWLIGAKQIFLSIILYCKFLLTQQKPSKSYKLYDDYHQPIYIRLPNDILAKRHPNLPRANSLDHEAENFHAKRYFPDDSLPNNDNDNDNHEPASKQPDSGHESHSDSSHYSSHESESEFSDTAPESEEQEERQYKVKPKKQGNNIRPKVRKHKRKPIKRGYLPYPTRPFQEYSHDSRDNRYETLQEPSEFEHLAHRLHDPNGLLVKVYRGPTIIPSQEDPSRGTFASFGYYIKYPDS